MLCRFYSFDCRQLTRDTRLSAMFTRDTPLLVTLFTSGMRL